MHITLLYDYKLEVTLRSYSSLKQSSSNLHYNNFLTNSNFNYYKKIKF